MRYHIPTIGLVRGAFTLGGVQYPANWLSLATDAERTAIGAVPEPVPGHGQAVEHDPATGWIVRDLTAEEIAAATGAAVYRLWRESWEVWGRRQFADEDRQTVVGWLAAGLLNATGQQMWRDIVAWHDAVFTGPYAAAKAAIEAAGAWVEPDWASWPACPHQFYDFLAQRGAP